MEDWLLWFLLAIGLLVGEMFTAGFWLACLAVGAAVAGVVGLIPGMGFVAQGIAFAAASIAATATSVSAIWERSIRSPKDCW